MPRALLTAFALCAIPCAAQFQIQTSNTTADLRGIHNVGNGVAWASGTVLRTEDGGNVWQTCAIPPGAEKLDFRGIQAFDANTAIVMSSGKGDLSRLYKTTDGCHTWKLIFTNPDPDGFWDAFSMDSEGFGWLLGDPVNGRFVVFYSASGGRTWRRQISSGLQADPNLQGAFAASNTSITASDIVASFASGGMGGAYVYSLVEVSVCLDCPKAETKEFAEGRHDKWERHAVPLGTKSSSSGIFSLGAREVPVLSAPKTMVAVGGDYQKPDEPSATSAFTMDSGKSWLPTQTPPHGYRSSVAYSSDLKLWITVGPNGTDVSTDDGRNWRAIHPSAALHEAQDADRNWNALSLPFVVGPHGRIGKLDPAALGK